VDVSSPEGLSKAMHLFEPRHFIMPFLAHAVGTLAGALAAYLIAASYKAQIAYVIGAVFLCGGLAASFLIPAPTWFIALDLLAAYLPTAWLGIQIGTRMKQRIYLMLGFKNFGNAAIAISGVELAQKIRKGQFDITQLRSGVKVRTPQVWDAILGD
jgi:hypothetical protein